MALWVCNRNTEEYTGRWDGKDYHFRPGDWIEVPETVARELLGHPEHRDAAILRHGLHVRCGGMNQAREFLARFEIASEPEPAKPREFTQPRKAARLDEPDAIVTVSRGKRYSPRHYDA